jgi:hypothetical protein
MITLSFCNLLIHLGFPEFVKSVMYAGVGIPKETYLRLYACFGLFMKEVSTTKSAIHISALFGFIVA